MSTNNNNENLSSHVVGTRDRTWPCQGVCRLYCALILTAKRQPLQYMPECPLQVYFTIKQHVYNAAVMPVLHQECEYKIILNIVLN
jgi:hypothetical protein